MDWMILDEGEINRGPFNLSTSGNNSHNSSAKSSISASTDSTADYNVHQTPSFRFGSKFEGCAESWSKKIAFGGMGLPGDSPPFGSGEQSIGLKLGKRTYFENTVKSTSMGAVKKNRAPGQNGPVYCQVQGCGADLSSAKDYHKKHRVCDSHSKSQKVMVGGIELRFCQQCSRFHSLSEFDEKKRSCRKRLSDHNARRRKPQQQTIQFNSPTLSSTFNGGGIHQMSFLVNNSPPVRPMTCAKSAWGDDNTHTAAKFTLTKGSYPLKSGGDGSSNQRLHMLGGTISPPPIIDMQNVSSASKNPTIQAFNPVSKGSLMSSLDNAAAVAAAAPHRASSLLSSAYEPMQQHVFGEPMIQTIPEGVPVSSSEFWLQSVRSNDHHAMATSSTFQEFQLLKESYDADYYSNIY